MAGRAAHYLAKSRHAQRDFGQAAPKMVARDTDTTWIGPFVSSIQGIGEFGVNSIIALPLGEDQDARALRLRKLCSMGILTMRVVRVDGVFAGYRWAVAAGGQLGLPTP